MAPIDGRGRTIVIVDAFGSPTIGLICQVFDKPRPARRKPDDHSTAGPVPAFDPQLPTGALGGGNDAGVEWAHHCAGSGR